MIGETRWVHEFQKVGNNLIVEVVKHSLQSVWIPHSLLAVQQ